PFEISSFLNEYIKVIEKNISNKNLDIKKVQIEPGRSLVCNYGSTLYTVGNIKNTFGGKNYIFIDGGMTDNIRPALYQAKYEAILANKVNNPKENIYTIARKCCESGDILIKDINLPKAEIDDLLLINSTGAYTYSMSSNYNRIEKPAMIFINKDKINIAVKRESYDDLIKNDLI